MRRLPRAKSADAAVDPKAAAREGLTLREALNDYLESNKHLRAKSATDYRAPSIAAINCRFSTRGTATWACRANRSKRSVRALGSETRDHFREVDSTDRRNILLILRGEEVRHGDVADSVYRSTEG